MFIEHIMTFDQARKIEEDGDKNLVCTLCTLEQIFL